MECTPNSKLCSKCYRNKKKVAKFLPQSFLSMEEDDGWESPLPPGHQAHPGLLEKRKSKTHLLSFHEMPMGEITVDLSSDYLPHVS